jgi:IS5 family transposase
LGEDTGTGGTRVCGGEAVWGFAKVRYRGLEKNANRSFVALGLANLYLARARLTG